MTLGSHQTTIGKSQVHITPKWIIDALGPFDLDPCAAWPRPWDCAQFNAKEDQNGLNLMWEAFGNGLVWLNPPFERYNVAKWIEKLAQHDNGIALLHARTETAWFRPCWDHARAMLFMDRRIAFCRPDGTEQPANSGAPPVLIAFGNIAYGRLLNSKISGTMVTDWYVRDFGSP